MIKAIIFDLDVQTGFQRKANDAIDRIESSGIAFFESYISFVFRDTP